jgi:DNA gyrase/topoisomerase IV subunit A
LVFSVVASSTDTEEAHNELMDRLDVTTAGADAILGIQLRRLSRRDRARIHQELDELDAEHRRLSDRS